MSYDIPHTVQQSFIIYSRLQRDGSDQLIIPSGPMVWQMAAFTSKTGFATVAGGYSSAVVDITPVLSGGVLSFEIVGKQQGVYHSGFMYLTLTTVGDAEAGIQPAEATFAVPVVVLGKADLLGSGRTRTYYVGEYVEPFSIVPSAINPVIDYGGTSGSLKDVTQQYESGLYLTHVQDMIQQKTVDIKLGGTAARPGVYLAWVFCNQFTEGGQYDNLPSTFDRGNHAVPMIITILDDDYAEGNLMVAAPVTISGPASHYRVVMVTETVMAFASAEYLYNCELTQSSATLWAGSHTEGTGEESITYQYQLRLDGGSWKLEGRSFGWGETPPAFDLYESSAKRIPEQDVPHVHGWATVGIQGLSEFALWSREFDTDPWELFGFFDRLAPNVWEQQPQYCPQYEGLVTAPAVQFGSGFIYSEDEAIEGDFFELLVKKEFISTVVTPYAPPATESYTYTTIPEEGDPATATVPVRDVAVSIPVQVEVDGKVTMAKAPHSLNGQAEDGITVPGGKRWKFWPGARRVVPLNGTSGDVIRTAKIGCSYSRETSSDSQLKQASGPPWYTTATDSKSKSTVSWSGEVSIPGQSRGTDVISMMAGVSIDGGTLTVSSTTETDSWTDDSSGYATSDSTKTTVEPNEGGETISKAVLYMASGPFAGLCKHNAVSTGWAGFATTGSATSHTLRVQKTTGQPDLVLVDTTETVPLSRSAYYVCNSLCLISTDNIYISGYKKTTKVMSAHSSKSYTHNLMDDPWAESGSASCVASHNSVQEIISGQSIGSGTTYSRIEVNGVVTEETVSDPDGSIYASRLNSFIDIEIPPPSSPAVYSDINNSYGKSSDVEVIEFM